MNEEELEFHYPTRNIERELNPKFEIDEFIRRVNEEIDMLIFLAYHDEFDRAMHDIPFIILKDSKNSCMRFGQKYGGKCGGSCLNIQKYQRK